MTSPSSSIKGLPDSNTISTSITNYNHIDLAELIKLHELGFKLVPFNDDGTPAMPWTPIHDDPNFWTHENEKLAQHVAKFKNVATTFGKARLSDEKGLLYLNMLDVDSDEVYKALFNLANGDKEFSFIAGAIKNTYVTKTRKSNGFHIYWLSHKKHEPILTTDCKPDCEFEIKTDKRSGLATLPPSRHRDDHNFQYKNYGQQKLFVSDDMYDRLIEALKHCLRPKRGSGADRKKDKSYTDDEGTELDDADIQVIAECIRPYYKKGRRHPIVFGLSGLLHKSGISKDSTVTLIETLANNDKKSDVRNALRTIEETFKKDASVVAGGKYLLEVLIAATKDSSIAKTILDKIFRIIGKEDHIQWLTRAIMKEHTFKTMTDNEDIYCYDNENGVYVAGQEWRIKELSQLMYPQITTHALHEVVNQIKRRTYVDRLCFDSNIDILNLQNGLLNIHTLKFTKHSPNYLSLVQLPIKYNKKSKCPSILKFLGQVLRPKDVFTALELFGYCLYRTSKYQKALLCVGKGGNGKSTFLDLFEHFLGKENTGHVSLQDIMNNRFAAAGLYGKLANIFADLKTDKLTDTGSFKMLVSGDPMKAEKKHCDPFDFKNYAKLLFSTNEIPQSKDKTYAYFRRWIIFFFENIFEGDNNDPNVIDRLTTDKEMSGLLNLALIALKQLIKDNGFIHIDDIAKIEKDYTLNSNNVERFVRERCKITGNDEDFIICRDLWDFYFSFCKQNSLHYKDDNVFGMELRGLGVARRQIRINHEREYCYIGIRENAEPVVTGVSSNSQLSFS
jgi:P4 family phage/plasmid primase-like protien